MDEVLKRDQNFITVLGAITNDSDQDIRMLRVDPITKRLLVSATGISAGVTSLNGLTGAVILAAGSNITLTPVGNTITIASTGGSVSPLTTKGDLYTFTSVDARLPVGTNGQVLSADSGETTGLKWIAAPASGLTVGTTAIASGTTTRILYDNAGVLGEYIVGGGLLASGGTLSASSSVVSGSITITFDGQGGVLTTGQKGGFVPIPYSGTITGWTILSTNGTTGAALSGSITVDSWKSTYASFPPTVANTIWGTKPNLSSQSKNTASGLSIAVTAGDEIGFNVDSATTCVFVTLTLFITKS